MNFINEQYLKPTLFGTGTAPSYRLCPIKSALGYKGRDAGALGLHVTPRDHFRVDRPLVRRSSRAGFGPHRAGTISVNIGSCGQAELGSCACTFSEWRVICPERGRPLPTSDLTGDLPNMSFDQSGAPIGGRQRSSPRCRRPSLCRLQRRAHLWCALVQDFSSLIVVLPILGPNDSAQPQVLRQ